MKTTDVVLYALLAVIVAVIIISFYRYQKDPNNTFNILDILMENGRLSRLAMAFDACVVVMAWIMLKLTVDGKMTEGYLAIYGSSWVAPILVKMFSTNTGSSVSSATKVKTVKTAGGSTTLMTEAITKTEPVKPTKGVKK